MDKLCSLIPGKDKKLVARKAQDVKDKLAGEFCQHFEQEDKETLFSLVDGQMSKLFSTYSATTATRRADYTYDYLDQINWKQIGKAMGKAPGKCKSVYAQIINVIANPLVWIKEEEERLYSAIALNESRNVDWYTVTTMMGNKTRSQCQSKYAQHIKYKSILETH